MKIDRRTAALGVVGAALTTVLASPAQAHQVETHLVGYGTGWNSADHLSVYAFDRHAGDGALVRTAYRLQNGMRGQVTDVVEDGSPARASIPTTSPLVAIQTCAYSRTSGSLLGCTAWR